MYLLPPFSIFLSSVYLSSMSQLKNNCLSEGSVQCLVACGAQLCSAFMLSLFSSPFIPNTVDLATPIVDCAIACFIALRSPLLSFA